MTISSRLARVLLLPLLTTPAGAVEWLAGNGRPCDEVCRRDGRHPVTSDVHAPGGRETRDRFHVRAADTNGRRGGSDLRLRVSGTAGEAGAPSTETVGGVLFSGARPGPARTATEALISCRRNSVIP